jgi:hypothetical protein
MSFNTLVTETMATGKEDGWKSREVSAMKEFAKKDASLQIALLLVYQRSDCLSFVEFVESPKFREKVLEYEQEKEASGEKSTKTQEAKQATKRVADAKANLANAKRAKIELNNKAREIGLITAKAERNIGEHQAHINGQKKGPSKVLLSPVVHTLHHTHAFILHRCYWRRQSLTLRTYKAPPTT